MKNGFSTGSCAAAAAKAAAWMLFSQTVKSQISIMTPAGINFDTELYDIVIDGDQASCAVKKYSGDDPDITDGILIYAKVSYTGEKGIIIDGGKGVGRVTKPGLSIAPGMAAINPIPRRMIEQEVAEVCRLFDYDEGLSVIILVPEGEELSEKTFNPKLGIEGGISILGTKGIVEPMSSQAIIETTRAQLRIRRAAGHKRAALVFGNYGVIFLRDYYHISGDSVIICSNYIGRAIDMAREEGFEEILICGHAGKLVKLAGGIMNTHSREADCRMELIAAAAVRAGCDIDAIKNILEQNTTDGAFSSLGDENLINKTADILTEKIFYHINKRCKAPLNAECLMYLGDGSKRSLSDGAKKILEDLQNE